MTDPENLPNRPVDPLRAQVERVLSANYELDAEIGRGGMGVVYRARDKRLKRWVAIKLLPPELAYRPEIRSRFLREAETSAQLSHPHIVPIYTVEDADNLVFFIMAYVDGENLARRLHRGGPLSPDDARRVLREVAEALAYAHARGVIHRDIKPDNILLESQTGHTMVTDFGIARAVSDTADTRLTTTGTAIGTPAYMSPEQCAGDRNADGRSDLYSLGVVGYQMLCGELPFVATNTPSMLVKHLTEVPQPLHDRCGVPRDLNDVIMRCLAKDPDDRFARAADMVDALAGRIDAVPPRTAESAPVGMFGRTRRTEAPQLPAATELQGRASTSDARFTDVARWEVPPVRTYRLKLVAFLAASAAFIPLGLAGHRAFLIMTAIWGVYIIGGYARLWGRGYDWRDVFRRSRDTLFVDVVDETIDSTRALFDPARRQVVRERVRSRLRSEPGVLMPPSPRERVTGVQTPIDLENASLFPVVQEAAAARADVHRLMDGLPKADREMLPDVVGSANVLFGRIEFLATRVDELERADVPGIDEAIEREINELEAEANPLDEARSERRVRRLAQLKRQRVSMRDIRQRRAIAKDKLDRCLSAMRSMRMDLIRLGNGSRSYESVTQIAEQAIQLGQEVDAVLYAQDEIARVMDSGRR